MVTAQLKPMAVSYHVDKVVVLFGMSALVLAIEVDRILNGLTRPFWGWVSDHIGRENAIFYSFVLEAVAVFALLQLISHPLWFIALFRIVFFHLGKYFFAIPFHHGRPLWEQMGHDQLRRRLYGQRSGGSLCRTRCGLAICQNRFLVKGLLGDDCV